MISQITQELNKTYTFSTTGTTAILLLIIVFIAGYYMGNRKAVRFIKKWMREDDA